MHETGAGRGPTPRPPLDSPEFWRAAADGVPDLLLVVDAEGLVLYVNRAPDGTTVEDLIGRSLLDCVPAESREQLRASLRDLFQGRPLQLHEQRIVQADGTDRWYATHIGPIRLGEAVVAAVVVARDVTQQRRVAHHSWHWQRMDVVAHLAAGIVHDFNSVLAHVGSAAQLMADDDTGATRDELQTILAEVKRGAALGRQLLAFLQHLPPVVEEVDLNLVVRDVVAIMRTVVHGRITIVDSLDPAGVVVRGNRTQLEQVVMNLVLNARDALGGQGSIAIMTTIGPTGARLLISDTGSGMSDDTRERVFEPFFTTKARTGGTGLGLSTAHAIVTGAGGTIEVFSAPGVGTTFVVTLPPADTAHADAGRR